MKKKIKIFLTLLVILIILIFTSFMIHNSKNEIQQACIEEKACFQIEIADTQEKRALGLSYRESMEENKGMLFIFDEEETPGFWMKNMDFPLDIIWIDKNLNIIGVEKNLQPCLENSCLVFYPNQKIKYVLEINSGLYDYFDFKENDSIYLK